MIGPIKSFGYSNPETLHPPPHTLNVIKSGKHKRSLTFRECYARRSSIDIDSNPVGCFCSRCSKGFTKG